jgi:hypothetical protein
LTVVCGTVRRETATKSSGNFMSIFLSPAVMLIAGSAFMPTSGTFWT